MTKSKLNENEKHVTHQHVSHNFPSHPRHSSDQRKVEPPKHSIHPKNELHENETHVINHHVSHNIPSYPRRSSVKPKIEPPKHSIPTVVRIMPPGEANVSSKGPTKHNPTRKKAPHKSAHKPSVPQKDWRSSFKRNKEFARTKLTSISTRYLNSRSSPRHAHQAQQKKTTSRERTHTPRQYSSFHRMRHSIRNLTKSNESSNFFSFKTISFLICLSVTVIAIATITAVVIVKKPTTIEPPVDGVVLGVSDFSHGETGMSVGSGEYPKNTWPHQGRGLRLEVYNALTENWYPFFEQALHDWADQSPKSLILSTREVAADAQCSPVNGVLKVCNGNYGATGWRVSSCMTLSNKSNYFRLLT